MRHDLASLKTVLAKAPVSALRAKLTRRVEYLALARYNPPNWLFTSGKPKRYNPAGVHCVYFGGDVHVTRIEYEEMWRGLQGAHQPATEFIAEVHLRRVLDLTSPATLKVLKIAPGDLFKNWRRATRPTLTQLLGQAVNETKYFSAIRYPSAAGGRTGGLNIVIFRDCVQSSDSVRILGPTKKPLQKWP